MVSQEARNDQRHGGVEVDVEEFDGHVRRLKKNKAAGCDGLEGETMIFAGEETKNKIRIIMSERLGGGRLLEECREATIFPLHKKGIPPVAANYRGISLVNSGYNLYASVIHSRLEKFAEENSLLRDTQNGFRLKRSTTDNIFILNHCAQKVLKMAIICTRALWT